MCVRQARRKLDQYTLGGTDLVPAPSLVSCWPAVSSDWPSFELPVGDATALGTLRTRLETRTKESNMCASHWDIVNLKAQ